MSVNINACALNLEGANAKLEAAATHYSQLSEQIAVYSQRIAEHRSKSAKAVADFRAGTIDMGVAGIIEKTAALDIADLEKLLAPVTEALTAAHAELTKSQEIVSHAAKAFKDAERLIAFNEFAAVVKGLERKFLEAVVELHKLGPERNSGSSWKTFTPSKELADLVGLQVVPILR